jgi:antitoxin component YwqK of YwqJK toxin-antitoxin module
MATKEIEELDDDGNLVSKTTVVDGVRSGPYVRYRLDGSVEREQMYRYDKLHGKSTTLYDNGQVDMVELYLFGQLHGLRERLYINGEIAESSTYVLGRHHGRHVLYVPDRSVMEYVHGIKHGLYRNYHDGVLVEEVTYRAGKKHGTYTKWTTDGVLHSTRTYVMNKLHGDCIMYDRDGSVFIHSTYSNGALYGKKMHVRDGIKVVRYSGTTDASVRNSIGAERYDKEMVERAREYRKRFDTWSMIARRAGISNDVARLVVRWSIHPPNDVETTTLLRWLTGWYPGVDSQNER